MANACFRCKQSIQSGRTFCDGCRHEVDLDFSHTRESRTWAVLAGSVLLQILGVVAGVVWSTVGGGGTGAVLMGVFLAFPLALVAAVAIVLDAKHVRKRDDTEWSPSEWAVWGYAFAVFSMLFSVPATAYYLYRRRHEVGLSIRRS